LAGITAYQSSTSALRAFFTIATPVSAPLLAISASVSLTCEVRDGALPALYLDAHRVAVTEVHVADVECSLLAELLGVAVATTHQPPLNFGLGVGASLTLSAHELPCGVAHTSFGVIGRTSSPSMVTMPVGEINEVALTTAPRLSAASARHSGSSRHVRQMS
jgi:hypothetical protein